MKKMNRFLLRLGRRLELKRVWAYPETLQLIPTNACNLRCKNCPKTYYATDNRHIAPEVYSRVRISLFEHIKVLNLQGLGEPLLSPLFPEMIEDAERYGLKVIFTTNATLLKKNMIQKLVKIGADITISLDGAKPETHERSRPGSKFPQVIEAFALFKEEKEKQANSNFVLNINTVVNSFNVDELEEIAEIAAKYKIHHFNLINPGVGERTDEFALEAIGKHPELLAQKIEKVKNRAQKLGLGLSYPEFIVAKKKSVSEETNDTPQKPSSPQKRLFPGRCLDPWNMIYIDVDGWVRPCCRAIWLGMGNILENSFWEIWNNAHYKRLRASINTNNPPEFCRNCNTNWGINRGDEFFVEKLSKMGITLPKPPSIGVVYSKEDGIRNA